MDSGLTELPAALPLSDLKRRHIDVVRELVNSHYNYEQIAKILTVSSGAVLRHYLNRKRPPRSDSDVLHQIHRQLLDAGSQVRRLLSPETVEKYFEACIGQQSDRMTYEKTYNKPINNSNLYAFSLIIHDFFSTEYLNSINNIKRITGKYYAYRTSVQPNTIIKSYIEIAAVHSGLVVEFKHYHPDRYYGDLKNNLARYSYGATFFVDRNIYMIGNTENGQGVDIFALRKPSSQDFRSITGYNLTTNLDGILLSARTILIKRPEANKDGVRRIAEAEFNSDEERFEKELLANEAEPYLCENISLVGMRKKRLRSRRQLDTESSDPDDQ